jgi:hypothetical protein
MRERTFWMITIILLIWAALFLVAANAVRSHAQNPLAQFAAHNNALATAERDAKDEVGSTRGRRLVRSPQRLFMKSHIQIEDDPRIWQQAAALIDWQISQSRSIGQAQAPGVSAVGP